MLLKLLIPLVSFAAVRYVAYSDQPDLVELRAQVAAMTAEMMATAMPAPKPTPKTQQAPLTAMERQLALKPTFQSPAPKK